MIAIINANHFSLSIVKRPPELPGLIAASSLNKVKAFVSNTNIRATALPCGTNNAFPVTYCLDLLTNRDRPIVRELGCQELPSLTVH